MIVIVIYISMLLFLGYQFWKAPLLDEKGNIIVEEKKLKDLFKKK